MKNLFVGQIMIEFKSLYIIMKHKYTLEMSTIKLNVILRKRTRVFDVRLKMKFVVSIKKRLLLTKRTI